MQPQILKRSHERDYGWTDDMESLNNFAKKAVLNNLLKASAQRQVDQALQEAQQASLNSLRSHGAFGRPKVKWL